MEHFFESLLNYFPAIKEFHGLIVVLLSLLSLILLALLIQFLGKIVLSTVVHRIIRRSTAKWDDILFDSKVFLSIVRALPPLLVLILYPLFFSEQSVALEFIHRLIASWMIIAVAAVISTGMDAINGIYQTANAEVARRKPIKGYLQMIKIFVYIVAGVLVVTGIVNVSPVGILSGLGAMSAVLLLVFKDSIMGFVSSLQLSGNDLVRIGDWIEMPKYGADGNVVDITLQSIMVRNWDMTITSIPIYALVSDSFKNWRGMSESPGRRVKRVIYLDMKTVRFLTEEDIDRLSKFRLLADYLHDRRAEIADHNAKLSLDASDRISGRHLTNLGTFREYANAYLSALPQVNKEMTHMVRYLEATSKGLPMEIYLFVSQKDWVLYEGIQSDIMDHLLSILGEFSLRVYQEPSGWDIQELGKGRPGADA